MKKKIIFVTKALWVGGIETALINLLSHIRYEQYDVSLLVLKAELDMLGQIPQDCRVMIADRDQTVSFKQSYRYSMLFHLTEETEKPSKLHRAMMWTVPAIRWVENRFYIRYIRDLMTKEQYDTAVIYSDVVAEIAIRAVKADKYLMYYHHGAMRLVYHDQIAYKTCEKIIAVSRNQAEELKKFIPKYADKITVIHNLTDVKGIRSKSKLPIEEEFDQSKYNIVTVGRVSHEKGMDLAIRACARLVEDGFDNIRWWVIGGGPAMQEVKSIVDELHMREHIILTGMKDNPYPYIWQADLYVQPSRFEGYPMTILEALILGKPVVSTDNNGARELLQNHVTGVLCPIDIGCLAEAIETLLLDRGAIMELQKNVKGLRFEVENENCIRKIEELL